MLLYKRGSSSFVRLVPLEPDPNIWPPRPVICAPVAVDGGQDLCRPIGMEVGIKYGGPDELFLAIREGGFGYVKIDIDFSLIPHGGTDKRYIVREWIFDKATEVHNALHVVCMTHGRRLSFADPMTALAVAKRLKERDVRRFEYDRVTLFSVRSGIMELRMTDCEGTKGLLIRRVSLDSVYDWDTRFLLSERLE